MKEKIVIGDRVIEMEIWRVGPGYTDEERERMRRPDVGKGEVRRGLSAERGVRSAECGAGEPYAAMAARLEGVEYESYLETLMISDRLACGL